ncbi:hypothetical protein [Amycolatopsis sp. NBC_00345]|uniref:hypothetical protein n=1 Tax=Amycolatopsis sp. NBC_00345 TaxID=2975955 RepID=UPI002E260EB5
MTPFPPATTETEFDRLTRAGLLPPVRALLNSLGVHDEAEPFADGSLPVYAVGAGLVLTPAHPDTARRPGW